MSLAIRLVVMLKFYCFSSMIRFLFSVTSAPTLFYQEKSEIILNIKSIFDRDMKMRHQMSDNRMISLFCVKIWIMQKLNEGIRVLLFWYYTGCIEKNKPPPKNWYRYVNFEYRTISLGFQGAEIFVKQKEVPKLISS